MAEPLAGTHLAHTFAGEPKSDTEVQATHGQVAPAPFGVPYVPKHLRPHRLKKCRANNDTCNGWKIAGEDYCPVHAGKLIGPRTVAGRALAAAAEEEVPDEPPADA